MMNHNLNLTSNEYYKDKKHGIKDFANKLPLNFNGVTYTGDENSNNYKKGRFSLFLKPKGREIGYKIFVGFREEDRQNEPIKIYSEEDVVNVKKVYDILSSYILCPVVHNIFSVNVNIFGNSYLTYGLEIQNIDKKRGGSKDQFRGFQKELKKVCEVKGLRRLSRRDRKDILQGGAMGSVDNIMYEASTKADNVVFDGKKYILIDIDPMWVVL